MKDKPDIEQVKQVVQEAANLEEIGSGGYKVVYKALIGGKTEAIKLVQIPSDESDETIRDENLRRIERELDILSKRKSPYLVKLGSIAPHACEIYDKTGNKRPLFASLIICREALQDRKEFEDFINDITILETRPDGFYIIIASRSSEALSDIYHTDVVANWMMFNLSLTINGFQVINGYSDLLTPFLGTAGGVAGATGWWSNLRVFSIDRFFPSVGGRLPIIRYLSKLLLNRITFSEKEALIPFVPGVLNQLPHDQDYDSKHSPETERSREVLQSWEALKSLIEELSDNDVARGLDKCFQAISRAEQAYSEIASFGILLDQKSRDEHILPLLDGLRQFKERAEL